VNSIPSTPADDRGYGRAEFTDAIPERVRSNGVRILRRAGNRRVDGRRRFLDVGATPDQQRTREGVDDR
jgi:hypothetical protein